MSELLSSGVLRFRGCECGWLYRVRLVVSSDWWEVRLVFLVTMLQDMQVLNVLAPLSN